jgi:hypothetical protein
MMGMPANPPRPRRDVRLYPGPCLYVRGTETGSPHLPLISSLRKVVNWSLPSSRPSCALPKSPNLVGAVDVLLGCLSAGGKAFINVCA